MKRHDRRAKYRIICCAVTAITALVGWFLRGPATSALIPMLSEFVPQEQVTAMVTTCRETGAALYLAATLIVIARATIWAIQHQFFRRGLRYAVLHAYMIYKIKTAFLETPGYSVDLSNQEADLPCIRAEFSPNLASGTIKIQNHIKYNGLLEKVNLSPALGRYVIVERPYLCDDENWYIYQIENSHVEWRFTFSDYQEFKRYCLKQELYTFFIDKRGSLPLCSMLLVGETGTGKSYTLYTLVLQLLSWRIPPVLYFADPKNSGLNVMGDRISPQRNAEDIKDIIELLERFYASMQRRKAELKELLKEKLDADYRHWHLKPHILIFDELAAFQAVVNTFDKATRDRVAMILRNIVFQGRQLGFFLWSIMQKSDAKDIPTAIRDNLPWKVVLGLAEDTTYMTAFEHSADLPKRNFGLGEGLYTYSGRTREPKVISFPTLNFDILAATEEAVKRPPVM